ncbi:MAG: type VI secretion system membrane subunit TssM [Pigmentiphaga sp.]|uniref:type VI secretion system membrane subunit TssM n=1 Tax=Pigmentiphaga sp. TaxID=1977564 RepID=UPI0029AFDEFB|nr:type VI secretion system membrane subunit TssM [Pigmentiphaga sp.]MDX3905819.1 type VI secretion system membrane subunit TssM [Pigmentiphaga sp.]
MNMLLNFLLSRGLWNFLGLLALAVLIWAAGPLVAIGDIRPLESRTSRIALIAAIFTIWLVRLAWRKWREGRLNAQLLGQLSRPARTEENSTTQPPASELRELEERFAEAADLLKKTRFHNQSVPLFERFSRQYLYQLPWYVFIGAPGSGKTTALVNSGLEFPLADRFGKMAFRGVGGTRNCDWWFTNDAVLLDTAGRYTTHESDRVGDEREWQGFLGLLRKFRGRQPINGAILTISVADLLTASEAERAQHAAVLRRRLQELRTGLGIQFPIYVLVTKMDLLSGFEEYFSDFSREELAQVWGFTFEMERVNSPDFDLLQAFHDEYELLHRRLNDALPDLLAEQADPAKRALSYLLPQQFAGLRYMLARFLSDIFGRSRFEEALSVRGVYFTSGTQGGEMLDPAMGGIKRYLGVAGAAPKAVALVPGEHGRSYFLKHVLQKVIFEEAGLAGRNLRWERRNRLVHWAGYATAAVLLAALAAGWLNSYRNNARYLDEVAAKIPPLQQLGAELAAGGDNRLGDVLPFLSRIWELPRSERFDIDAPPLSYGLGLYQGDKIHAAARGVYQRGLDQTLAHHVARRIENALRNAPPNDLEYTYEALRAYLMLYDAGRYDGDFMLTWVLSDLLRTMPAGYTRQQYDTLHLHLSNLLRDKVLKSPFVYDENLVQQQRERLASYSPAERAYSRLRRILMRMPMDEFSVSSMAGPQAASVFRRTSGRPITEGVPGLFSYRGYWDLLNPRVDEIVARMRRDDAWVLGLEAPVEAAKEEHARFVASVKRLYFNDYIKQWDAYLGDLSLRKAATLLESIQVARTLSASDSPLIRLANEVAQQTTLLRDSDSTERSLVDRARERVRGTADALEQMFGPVGPPTASAAPAEDKPEAVVDRHFEPWRRLVTEGTSGQPPVAGTVALINELYTFLTSADAALRSSTEPPASEVVTKLRVEASRLPGPLNGVVNELSLSSANNVSGRYRASLEGNVASTIGLSCRQTLEGRYPFARRSQRDVAYNDLARLFGPGAAMDQFFQNNLASQVDTLGASWRFKPGIEGGGGTRSAYLDAFQRASVIRDVYFSGGKQTPSFSVSIKPLEMDPGISQMTLDVDGQIIRYAHGPQVATTVQWPGPRGGTQVRLQLTPQVSASGIATEGPWALNRFVDRAALAPGRSPEIVVATFDLDGRKVALEIAAHSVKSPFRLPEMEGFRCPGGGT